MTIEEKIDSLMYSYDKDWKKVYKKAPVTFEIKGDDKQYLYYFGANHTCDINHPQFVELEKYWDEFIQKVDKTTSVVLEEGGIRPVLETKEESISKFGEAGFLGYLAKKDNVDLISPEPTQLEQIKWGEQKFSRDEIGYYYFARQIPQWHRTVDRFNNSLENYLQEILKSHQSKSNWKDFDFLIGHMRDIHQKIFSTEFDPHDEEFFKNIVDPTKTVSIINEVSLYIGRYRDIYIIKEILSLWEQGKSIFIVFGSGHAILQEPALKELLH